MRPFKHFLINFKYPNLNSRALLVFNHKGALKRSLLNLVLVKYVYYYRKNKKSSIEKHNNSCNKQHIKKQLYYTATKNAEANLPIRATKVLLTANQQRSQPTSRRRCTIPTWVSATGHLRVKKTQTKILAMKV